MNEMRRFAWAQMAAGFAVARPAAAASIVAKLTDELMFEFDKRFTCDTCKGTGGEDHRCESCHGSGQKS